MDILPLFPLLFRYWLLCTVYLLQHHGRAVTVLGHQCALQGPVKEAHQGTLGLRCSNTDNQHKQFIASSCRVVSVLWIPKFSGRKGAGSSLDDVWVMAIVFSRHCIPLQSNLHQVHLELRESKAGLYPKQRCHCYSRAAASCVWGWVRAVWCWLAGWPDCQVRNGSGERKTIAESLRKNFYNEATNWK